MRYNPYAICRFLAAGALVFSVINMITDPHIAWASNIVAWAAVLLYDDMRRKLMQILIMLKEEGVIDVFDDTE